MLTLAGAGRSTCDPKRERNALVGKCWDSLSVRARAVHHRLGARILATESLSF